MTPLEALHDLIGYVMFTWKTRGQSGAPGALVARLKGEAREAITKLKSSDIEEGKLTKNQILYAMPEEYWRGQDYSKLMTDFDRRMKR